MRSLRIVAIAVCGLIGIGAESVARAEPVTTASPDGKVVFTLSITDDGPTFGVSLDGRALLADSPLGLVPEEGPPLGPGLRVVRTVEHEHDETWTPVWGTASPIRDQYHESTIELAEPGEAGRRLVVVVRAYDDGVAFRYHVPGPASGKAEGAAAEMRLTGERTAFRFTDDPRAIALPVKSVRTSYEGAYTIAPLSSLGDALIGLPLTLSFKGGAWGAITEADLDDYGGLFVTTRADAPKTLGTRLASVGKTPAVVRTPPFDTPWRVILLGRRPGDLIESQIVVNCNPPCAIADPSWIRPGKAMWDWWPKQMVNGTDFAGGMNTATLEHYADFAADNGIEYLIVDEGWSWWANVPGDDGKVHRVTDITRAVPAVDLPELLAYCKARGVRVWLWLTWSHCAAQMEEAFPLYEKWGIAGVKVDYMGREDQWMVNWYRQVCELAAKHHLMVNFHGAYKPTGMRRTWPNLMTREAVMGLEHSKWSSNVTPEHNVTIPFVRMLAGPMDYTPGGFQALPADRFKSRDAATFVQGTRCHALAQYVVYESPLQTCADYPESYRGQVGFEFLRWVPTTWDESHVISGDPGQFIVMARRNGRAWYLGCMTNSRARTVRVPLSFLGPGEWRADVFADGARAAEVPDQIRRERLAVRANNTLAVTMAPGGGYAARFRPQDAPPPSGQLVRHLVGFRLRADLTDAQKQEVLAACDHLPEAVPLIREYERGPNTSHRGLSHDFEHAMLMTFRSQADLAAYVEHPAHQAFVAKYKPWLADLIVIDWETPEE